MALTITSISPAKVLSSRGEQFSIVGDFAPWLGQGFRVYVGPNGDSSDTPCYSGIVGQGNVIYPISNSEMRGYLPVLEPTDATPHNVYVELVSDSLENDLLTEVLEVAKDQFYSRVFELRSVFPPFYRMGPRNMTALEPLP